MVNTGTQEVPRVEQPVCKHTPADFLVRESLLIPLSESDDAGRYTYLELRKSGLTTFEAAALVAEHLGLAQTDVQFAGLKDEDGISEQLIAVNGAVEPAALDRFNAENRLDARRFVRLRRHGTGDEPLRTGGLTGNSFRLRVRNLSEGVAARLAATRRYDFHFLNYYDVQRFGVAGAPKTTHLLGQALLSGSHAAALDILRAAGTPESAAAQDHAGPPEEFFESLNPRVVGFFKSAYASSVWNDELRGLIASTCSTTDTYEQSVDGIPFLFCRRQADVRTLLARHPMLKYVKYYDDAPGGQVGLRGTVVQVQIHCHDMGPDDAYPGGYQCELSFFLPSGAYATTCVRQLANTLDLDLDTET